MSDVDIRPIPGEPDYGASADGSVWSAKSGKWRKLRLHSDGTKGYLKVKLNHAKQYKVHVLIAAALLGERPEGMTVNHLNGVKTDNRAENLEYCTYTENNQHAYRIGLREPTRPLFTAIRGRSRLLLRFDTRRGEASLQAKLTEDNVREIRTLRTQGVPMREIGKRFGVSATQVMRIEKGRKWAHVT